MDPRKYLPQAPLFSKKGLCAYCGRVAKTNDHAIASCLLPESRVPGFEPITVPACEECNKSFSKDENLVKAILAHVSFEDDLIKEKEQGGRVHRAMQKDQKLSRFIAEAFTPDGYFRTVPETLRPIERVLTKAVMGLYFRHYGRIVPANRISLLALDHQERRTPSDLVCSFCGADVEQLTGWPEVTGDCRELERFVVAGPDAYELSMPDWLEYYPGVLEYIFAKHLDGGLVCILDVWRTLTAAFGCPWPDRRGPLRKEKS